MATTDELKTEYPKKKDINAKLVSAISGKGTLYHYIEVMVDGIDVRIMLSGTEAIAIKSQ